MKHRINIVHSEDYEAVYINDELVYEDHHIDPMEMVLQIKAEIPGSTKLNDLIVDEWWADEEWINEEQYFPRTFNRVKLRF